MFVLALASLLALQWSEAVVNRLHCATAQSYLRPPCSFLSGKIARKLSAYPYYGNLNGHVHLVVAVGGKMVHLKATTWVRTGSG